MIDSLQVQILVLSTDATIRPSVGGPALGASVEYVPTASGLMDALTETTAALIIDEATEPAYLSLIRRARRTTPGVDAVVIGGPKVDVVRQQEKREHFFLEAGHAARGVDRIESALEGGKLQGDVGQRDGPQVVASENGIRGPPRRLGGKAFDQIPVAG